MIYSDEGSTPFNALSRSRSLPDHLNSDAKALHTYTFLIDTTIAKECLLAQEDTEHHAKITEDDEGPKVFTIGTAGSDGFRLVEIRGTYFLSNLLQELVLADRLNRGTVVISGIQLAEWPVDRIRRRIKDVFWTNLLRRMDSSFIGVAAKDGKDWTEKPRPRIYVPWGLTQQLEHYQHVAQQDPRLNLEVLQLPKAGLIKDFVRSLFFKPGILALDMKLEHGVLRGRDFVVPGGRFNEMYGWDSYFCALGLLESGRVEVAKDMVLNFCFQINHYGRILNANRTYYLERSQPPFLTDMIRRTYEQIKSESGATDFLRMAMLTAIKEYNTVWMAAPRLDPSTGLSRYRPEGTGVPPEVEPGQYDHLLIPRAKDLGMTPVELVAGYNAGTLEDSLLDEYFLHDRAVRESGHDTSYRLERICADLATVDLNALLYKYEHDIAWAIREAFDDDLPIPGSCTKDDGADHMCQSSSSWWIKQARKRKESVDRYLWNGSDGMYHDYNTHTRQQTSFESVTTLWPLWSGLASEHQARRLVNDALPLFEMPGGLVTTTERSTAPKNTGEPQRQWDYPCGWAPHQMLAWEGLRRYGYHVEAERLAYRWVNMITTAAIDFHGTITEKYNVTQPVGQHKVDAEYGNQGRDFKGVAQEGFGWTNASYVVGLTYISEKLQRTLGLGATYEQASRPPSKGK